ncbi:GNAT family N-acetyltransferase [Streptomyces sp. LMG1-1-1.1]|uniref:GNAT family N-acetyltransferase n=1 Tax=Streptomyces sp. LMG1-1-1.1 TaxID=3135245 RepID=UPI0034668C83
MRAVAPDDGREGAPVVRAVTSADWPLWREARLASPATSPEAFDTRLADWAHGGEERWRARFDDPAGYGVLAALGARPVGLAAGLRAPDGVPELRSVRVAPDTRGRGLAARLVTAVETWARATGAPALRLAVLAANARALALYERLGYTAHAVTAAETIMRKRLRPQGRG